jgi:hypothetical protein
MEGAHMTIILRMILAVALLGVAGFCLFGFLASYEYSDPMKRLPWQIGYGVLGAGCLAGVVRCFVFGRRGQEDRGG